MRQRETGTGVQGGQRRVISQALPHSISCRAQEEGHCPVKLMASRYCPGGELDAGGAAVPPTALVPMPAWLPPRPGPWPWPQEAAGCVPHALQNPLTILTIALALCWDPLCRHQSLGLSSWAQGLRPLLGDGGAGLEVGQVSDQRRLN